MMCITLTWEADVRGIVLLTLDWFVLPRIDQSQFQWLGI